MKKGTHITQRKEEREGPRSRPSRLWAPDVVQRGEGCQRRGFLLPRQQRAEGGGSGNFSRELGIYAEDRFKQQQHMVLNNEKYSVNDLLRKSE